MSKKIRKSTTKWYCILMALTRFTSYHALEKYDTDTPLLIDIHDANTDIQISDTN